jgi:hypothetical protein
MNKIKRRLNLRSSFSTFLSSGVLSESLIIKLYNIFPVALCVCAT